MTTPSERGAALATPVARLGAGFLLAGRALAGLRARAWPRGEVLRQAHEAGNRSILLVATTLAFVGMVLTWLAGTQARRIVGDLSILGPAFLQLVIREFGPIIVALMVAARVGAGIAAEVATMVVTEQVDALRMNAADPIRWIVSPRVLAVAVANLALTVVGSAVAIAAGTFTAWKSFALAPQVFLDFSLVHPGDVVTALIKAVAFGICVPVVAAAAGLEARGGSEGVGRATTRAVVLASIGVIVLDAVIGGLAFGVGL